MAVRAYTNEPKRYIIEPKPHRSAEYGLVWDAAVAPRLQGTLAVPGGKVKGFLWNVELLSPPRIEVCPLMEKS